jgi:hypothetical protein
MATIYLSPVLEIDLSPIFGRIIEALLNIDCR